MAIIKRTILAKTDLNAESDASAETISAVKYIDKIVKDGVEYEIHAANSGSGSGKSGLSRFITFDNQFMGFSWYGGVGDYVSVVGQVKHGHGRRRIKNHTHGMTNNLTIPMGEAFDTKGRTRSDQYFGTHSRNSFSLFNNFKDESYKLNIPDNNNEGYQCIDYIMSYILKSTNFTPLTPAEFVPVYHC